MTTKAQGLALRASDHGRHIFFYNNISTNQVVYSLDRTMNNTKTLKQLPYAGKHTVPAQLRKDYWRPLLTVTFPSGPQGLDALRQLREWRKLHELAWDPADRARYRRQDAKEDEDKEDYLGPKRERKENAIKARREKGRLIMDQKANSIADLAAVLLEQEKLGHSNAEAQEKAREERDEATQKERHAHNARARADILELAERAEAGELQSVRVAIGPVKKEQQALARSAERSALSQVESEHLQALTAQLAVMRQQRERMTAARDAVRAAKKQAEERQPAGGKKDGAVDVEIELPPMFQWQAPAAAALEAQVKPSTKPVPKRGVMRKLLIKERAPVFKAEGVRIRWSNPLDAEYAATWPQAVKHDIIGLAKHVAPNPDDEAVVEVEDRPWRLRKGTLEARTEALRIDGGEVEQLLEAEAVQGDAPYQQKGSAFVPPEIIPQRGHEQRPQM